MEVILAAKAAWQRAARSQARYAQGAPISQVTPSKQAQYYQRDACTGVAWCRLSVGKREHAWDAWAIDSRKRSKSSLVGSFASRDNVVEGFELLVDKWGDLESISDILVRLKVVANQPSVRALMVVDIGWVGLEQERRFLEKSEQMHRAKLNAFHFRWSFQGNEVTRPLTKTERVEHVTPLGVCENSRDSSRKATPSSWTFSVTGQQEWMFRVIALVEKWKREVQGKYHQDLLSNANHGKRTAFCFLSRKRLLWWLGVTKTSHQHAREKEKFFIPNSPSCS